ncbi:hypothetical protein JW868_02455 [Candidatus Woesearchaeota archaeon]|nr:hypothetical protein [Candidatus Woesearchaeota archaeon]
MQCPKCGKTSFALCRDQDCPLKNEFYRRMTFNKQAKQDFSGQSPNLFVGRHGYPRVRMGVLSNENLPKLVDSPRVWSQQNKTIQEIIDIRMGLINSNFEAHIKNPSKISSDQGSKYTDMAQEVAMSSDNVEVEVGLSKKPHLSLILNSFAAPQGPAVQLKKLRVTNNPKIPKLVESAVNDDIKSSDAMRMMYKRNIDEHYLTKLLSGGTLGLQKNKILVPTRWSITAVDDTISKGFVKQIKNYPVTNYMMFEGGHLGNHYFICMFPEVWSYELLEMVAPKQEGPAKGIVEEIWTDHEPYKGRSSYASSTQGGYYAAKLGIVEKLSEMKRQASVYAFRIVTDEYYQPLGVWVVREAVRKTMQQQPKQFNTKQELLKHLHEQIQTRFSFNPAVYTERSILVNNLKSQKKLWEY